MLQNSITNTKKSASVKAESSNKRSKYGDNRRKARGRKSTFWNQKRINAGVTYRDIGEYLHCSTSLAGRFFTGQVVPKDEYIDSLCDWFGVDRIVGEREFRNANRKWDTIYDGKIHPKLEIDGEKKPEPKVEKREPVVVKTSTVFVKEKKTMDISGLNRAVYRILDYDSFVEFTKLLARRKSYEREEDFRNEVIDFIGQHVYGADGVDYKKYNEIMKLLG